MRSCSVLFILLFVINYSYCQGELRLDWDLESTKYFHEILVPREYSSAIRAEENEKLYRFFQINEAYENNIMDVFARHHKVWGEYLETLEENNKPDKRDFISYARIKDPFYLSRAE